MKRRKTIDKAAVVLQGAQSVQVRGREMAKEINRLIDKGDAIMDAGTVYVKKGGLFVPVKVPR